MSFKGVLLDFDGTIADTTQLIVNSWQHTYRTLTGTEGDVDYILSTFGETLRDALLDAFPEHDIARALDVYRGYQMRLQDDNWFLFPGVEEMLQQLKARDIPVGIVTSRTGKTCRQGLSCCGIDCYIDALVTCDDTDAHKPDPEPALIGLQQLQALAQRPAQAGPATSGHAGAQAGPATSAATPTAAETLFVGDTRFDIDCAHNAGMPAALVAWSATMKKDDPVGTWPAEYYIETPEDLLRVVLPDSRP